MHPHSLARPLWPFAVAVALLTGASVGAQNPPAQNPPAWSLEPAPADPNQGIRAAVEPVATDVFVRDPRGQFIADLKKDEFEIFEDGVRQQLVSFTLTHGGRVFN